MILLDTHISVWWVHGEIGIEKLSVMSVKESEGQWMMTLSIEMMGVAEALRKHHDGK